MGCKNPDRLVTDSAVCVDNLKAVAESWFDSHLTLVFVAALLLIGVCSFIANRSGNGNVRPDNISHELNRINNRLDGMSK